MKINTKSDFVAMDDGARLALHTWIPEIGIRYVVVISHGMAEYALRYDRFARFLAENGIAVYAHDHRGHGKTAVCEDDLGFLAEKDGFQRVVSDLRRIIQKSRLDFPQAKIILFGHSFGSFVAQSFIEQFSNEIDACILSGTAGPRLALSIAGNRIAAAVKCFKGSRYRSKFLDKLSFSSYLDRIPESEKNSPFAWLSRDKDQVKKYEADPLCGFLCTAGFFYDLTAGLSRIHRKKNMAGIRGDLPVFLFAGTADPVGGYTKTIRALAAVYRKNGIQDVSEKYYEDGRHEMLNELNYDEVYADIFSWITSH
ncbi:alpha/beta hydrolase [Treponema sp. OMZ 840]|uniref:alpha/beta hydrolase n=1 Tax=Treponema sp. OMZ 840 TaxID=244313 RepID=UPI003D8FA4C5